MPLVPVFRKVFGRTKAFGNCFGFVIVSSLERRLLKLTVARGVFATKSTETDCM